MAADNFYGEEEEDGEEEEEDDDSLDNFPAAPDGAAPLGNDPGSEDHVYPGSMKRLTSAGAPPEIASGVSAGSQGSLLDEDEQSAGKAKEVLSSQPHAPPARVLSQDNINNTHGAGLLQKGIAPSKNAERNSSSYRKSRGSMRSLAAEEFPADDRFSLGSVFSKPEINKTGAATTNPDRSSMQSLDGATPDTLRNSNAGNMDRGSMVPLDGATAEDLRNSNAGKLDRSSLLTPEDDVQVEPSEGKTKTTSVRHIVAAAPAGPAVVPAAALQTETDVGITTASADKGTSLSGTSGTARREGLEDRIKRRAEARASQSSVNAVEKTQKSSKASPISPVEVPPAAPAEEVQQPQVEGAKLGSEAAKTSYAPSSRSTGVPPAVRRNTNSTGDSPPVSQLHQSAGPATASGGAVSAGNTNSSATTGLGGSGGAAAQNVNNMDDPERRTVVSDTATTSNTTQVPRSSKKKVTISSEWGPAPKQKPPGTSGSGAASSSSAASEDRKSQTQLTEELLTMVRTAIEDAGATSGAGGADKCFSSRDLAFPSVMIQI